MNEWEDGWENEWTMLLLLLIIAFSAIVSDVDVDDDDSVHIVDDGGDVDKKMMRGGMQ